MRNGIRGFSLIEILAVLAVVALLLAIAIPVTGRVRATARFSRGLSNVRQWNSAMLLHAQDNRGDLPHQGFLRDDARTQALEEQSVRGIKVWYNALPRYFGEATMRERALRGALPKAGDTSVWVCPAALEYGSSGAAWLSYAPSVGLSNPGGSPIVIANLNRISEPSRTPLFGESTNNSPYRRSIAPPWFLNISPGTPSSNPVSGLAVENRWGGASGRAAIGFCDGSVKMFTSAILRDQARQSVRPVDMPDGVEYTGGTVHWRVFR